MRVAFIFLVIATTFILSCGGGGGGGGSSGGGGSGTVATSPSPPTIEPLTVSNSQAGGLYNTDQNITLSANRDSKIYYTLDGIDPNENSQIYSGLIVISETKTLKVLAVDDKGIKSNIVSYIYTIDKIAPLAQANLEENLSQAFDTPQEVSLSSENGAKIYYTIDESDPTPESSLYTKALYLNKNTTVKFIAIDQALNQSTVVTKSYIFNITAPTIWASIKGKSSKDDISGIILSLSKAGTIYYTDDGSDPKLNIELRKVYSSALHLTANSNEEKTIILKFFGIAQSGHDLLESDTVSETYFIDKKPPEVPKTDLVGGPFNAARTFNLHTADSTDRFAYVMDSSELSAKESNYNDEISLSQTSTIRAIAIDAVGNRSLESSFHFVFDMNNPQISVTKNGGTYQDSVQNISFTVQDESAVDIFYTTDGKTPTQSSAKWDGTPLSFTATTILKFLGRDSAGNTSSGSQTYTISTVLPSVSATSGGLFNDPNKQVEFTKSDPAIKIYYNLNNNDAPTTSALEYLNPISLSEGKTKLQYIFTREFQDHIFKSDLVTMNYEIDTQVPQVTLSSPEGTYSNLSSVTFSITDSNDIDLYVKESSATVFAKYENIKSLFLPLTSEGSHQISYYIQDKAGNLAGSSSAPFIATYIIDRTAPTVICTLTDGSHPLSYYQTAQALICSAQDTISNTNSIFYTLNGATPTPQNWASYSNRIDITQDRQVRVVAQDSAGNITASPVAYDMVIDTQNPTMSLSQNAGTYSWTSTTNPFTIFVTTTDDKTKLNLLKVTYQIDGSNFSPATFEVTTGKFSFTIPSGTHAVSVRSQDLAGNMIALDHQSYNIVSNIPTCIASMPSGRYVRNDGYYDSSTYNKYVYNYRPIDITLSTNLSGFHVGYQQQGTSTPSPLINDSHIQIDTEGYSTYQCHIFDDTNQEIIYPRYFNYLIDTTSPYVELVGPVPGIYSAQYLHPYFATSDNHTTVYYSSGLSISTTPDPAIGGTGTRIINPNKFLLISSYYQNDLYNLYKTYLESKNLNYATYSSPYLYVNEISVIKYFAIDEAGNRFPSSGYLTATYTMGVLPPTIAVAPQPGTYARSSLSTIQIIPTSTTYEPTQLRVSYQSYSYPATSVTPDSNGKFYIQTAPNLGTLTDTTLQYSIIVSDPAGNTTHLDTQIYSIKSTSYCNIISNGGTIYGSSTYGGNSPFYTLPILTNPITLSTRSGYHLRYRALSTDTSIPYTNYSAPFQLNHGTYQAIQCDAYDDAGISSFNVDFMRPTIQ